MYCLKISQRLALKLSWIPWLILSLYVPDLGASPHERSVQKSEGIGRNVVLMVTDDQGPDAGCYGNAVIKTPNTDAMVSWVDITPTILDFAGVLESERNLVKSEILRQITKLTIPSQNTDAFQAGSFHGRSFLSLLGQSHSNDWDKVYASHTFHEIQMYYPMRVVRKRRYKLIWNIASPLPFPFASDLWAAPTWQAQYKLGNIAPYGAQTVGSYIHRPKFELYDIQADPHEGKNLADQPQYAQVLANLQKEMRQFQHQTNDPWIIKWDYE